MKAIIEELVIFILSHSYSLSFGICLLHRIVQRLLQSGSRGLYSPEIVFCSVVRRFSANYSGLFNAEFTCNILPGDIQRSFRMRKQRVSFVWSLTRVLTRVQPMERFEESRAKRWSTAANSTSFSPFNV